MSSICKPTLKAVEEMLEGVADRIAVMAEKEKTLLEEYNKACAKSEENYQKYLEKHEEEVDHLEKAIALCHDKWERDKKRHLIDKLARIQFEFVWHHSWYPTMPTLPDYRSILADQNELILIKKSLVSGAVSEVSLDTRFLKYLKGTWG